MTDIVTLLQVRVFAPPDQIHQAKFALKAAVKVLDYYDSFFGEKYPLPKQGKHSCENTLS